MNRRSFLKAGAASVLYAACSPLPVWANASLALSASTRTLDINGRAATVFGLIGPDGRPGLILDQDQGFRVELHNTLGEETLIHWHGLTPPWPQDGVPDLPAPMMIPGEKRLYEFPLAHSGTSWMHAHTLQEQALLSAPLIVRSREDRARDEQEIVLMLHDFSFSPPEELLEKLTGGAARPGTMDHGKMGHGAMDHGEMGEMDMDAMSMAEQMKMPMDLNDIEYDAYLANDRTLEDPEVVIVEKGGVIRLRIINASASTAFTLDFTAFDAQVIAVDGQDVQPLKAGVVPLTMAQRADIRISIPAAGGSFPVLARREGTPHQTGIILSTLGASINRLESLAGNEGPVLDLAFEETLSALTPLSDKMADRATGIDLVGNMMTYRWAMKPDNELVAKSGERLEFTLTNQSMMAHPMHLHGHHFQVVAINGKRMSGAMRDTVLVPPMQQVTIAVDADNPGKWAFHCHHLYHMVSGMMSNLAYDGV